MRIRRHCFTAAAVFLAISCAPAIATAQDPASSAPKPTPEKSNAPSGRDNQANSEAVKGKKLVLKNGSFQVVREYQRNGDRVRYFSAERGDWEELPAAMVDWDATAREEVSAHKRDEALLKTVHHQETEQRADMPWDVDASLVVAPGIFLPPGDGLFVVEGKSVTMLNQVTADIHTDKKQVLKQVLTPVPIVPNKKNIEIQGARAVRRINSERPEFYLREPPPDPDSSIALRRSEIMGQSGPDIELVRLTVKGGKRLIESVNSLFGQEISENRNSISIQRWDIAQHVFRLTLSQDLPSGEYAFAEVLPDGLNLYVWDFGVDRK